ncbi:hypothetical protein HPB50_008832 [Hyalomma asiaticum]|uniref:Uncharacterized protein n=1 Tax=Hyalomma asiaticum TaxID=266040 RepID=A0ACB7TGY0_HYAAI|nr:hypothetical protein HPB50_008832 [Hyalomma asiaticum]
MRVGTGRSELTERGDTSKDQARSLTAAFMVIVGCFGLSPPFPPFWQPSPELNRHSITARLLKHFSLSPTLWIVIFPLPPRLRQLNMFYMLESLVPKSSAAQGPTPFARLLIALPFGTSTT